MMGELLYQRCPVCKGTLQVPGGAAVCDWPPELVGGDRCVCTRSSTPGWTATGLTLGQVEHIRAACEPFLRMARYLREELPHMGDKAELNSYDPETATLADIKALARAVGRAV
jgi:hypothetical protein